jgi:ATP-dependent DNA helicase RecG
MDLTASVQYVKGVGPQRAQSLAKSGIVSIEDLLLHLPLRYEDRRRNDRIADLRPGLRTSVTGTVAVAGLRRTRRMPLFEVLLDDATGRLKALWFNQPYLKDVLEKGKRVVLHGLVERDSYGGRQLMMSSPQYEICEDDAPGVHTGRIVPVYERLGPLSGGVVRRILTGLVAQLPLDLVDPLPQEIREALEVTGLRAALQEVHAPGEDADLAALNAARSPGHLRLILEEFFLFQAGLALRRQGLKEARKGIAFEVTDRTREAVKKILPFHLTEAQKRVLREIAADMQSPSAMNRLIQGDVGCGKTVVALLAMVVAVESGFQAAFMAPTEILAEQHFLTFRRLLARMPYTVELVTSAAFAKGRRSALARLESGEAQIAVGTHALIQEGVAFHRLGLAVVDEQHRFGVLQREDLLRKGYQADMLVMTATPIPRTLALTAYGDLDVSVVDERPPGRGRTETVWRSSSERPSVLAHLRRELSKGNQAFVVYPLVEESEKLADVKAAKQMADEWRAALPGNSVGLLYGRMPSADKEDTMAAFAAGRVRLLVATTVVEVGVDVPAATVMVIEHAERFGLAQLHQLRGRVGRGTEPSTCILVTHGRLSQEARARLEVMVRSDDGFAIAEKDLQIRGPGDVLGTRQWGMPRFRVGHLLRDQDLLERARELAFRVARDYATVTTSQDWERRFGLARVG